MLRVINYCDLTWRFKDGIFEQMSDKRAVEDLDRVMMMAEEWFVKYGEASPEAHKILKKLLRQNIPAAKNLDYFLDIEARRVDVVVYVSALTSLFGNNKKLAENVVDLLQECLSDYEISVEVKRFKGKEG